MSVTTREYMAEMAARALGKAARPELSAPGDGQFVRSPMTTQSPLRRHVERAAAHVSMGRGRASAGRMRALKKGVLRVANLFSQEQIVYNQEVVESLRRVDETVTVVQTQVTDLRARTATSELANDELRDTIDRSAGEVARLQELLEQTRSARTVDQTELKVLRSSVAMMTREARSRLPAPLAADQLATIAGSAPSLDQLYSDLEDRFRGTRHEIRARQSGYLTLFDHLRNQPGAAPVLDIGPGRGEWLSVLAEAGVAGYGIDTNRIFVEQCQGYGLDVRLEDGRRHLRDLPEASLGGVTALQVAEHLPFTDLVELVDQILRVLVPGGVMVLETPNPLNVKVGIAHFWLDPTHHHPLPSEFLQFLVRARGFVDVDLWHSDRVGIMDPAAPVPEDPHLTGLSAEVQNLILAPWDYAVVARKVAAFCT